MFLDRVQLICSKKNIKITNLIKELGMSSGILSKWKNGDVPKAETIAKIADYFNVSADYLLCRTDDPTPPGEKETHNPNLIDTSELSAESKKELEKYIKLLKLADKAKNMNDQMEEERKFKPKYQN